MAEALLGLNFLAQVSRPSMHLFRREPTGSARLYSWRGRRRVSAEVFFVNNVIPGENESLDSGRPVLRGIRHQNSFLVAAGNITSCPDRKSTRLNSSHL